MDNIEAFLTIYIRRHLSTVLEDTDNLPHYINAYLKGKTLNDLMLAHIITLEVINQCYHCLLAIVSNDEENIFDRIILKLFYTTLYRYGCLPTRYAESSTESLTFTKSHGTTIHNSFIVMITYGSI